MPAKKTDISAEWKDPDDAPELDAAWFADAELFHGDTFIRRGRGRPKGVVTKEQVSVRLDPDVLTVLRANGPGWQSRVNAILREALGLDAADAGKLVGAPGRT